MTRPIFLGCRSAESEGHWARHDGQLIYTTMKGPNQTIHCSRMASRTHTTADTRHLPRFPSVQTGKPGPTVAVFVAIQMARAAGVGALIRIGAKVANGRAGAAERPGRPPGPQPTAAQMLVVPTACWWLMARCACRPAVCRAANWFCQSHRGRGAVNFFEGVFGIRMRSACVFI